MMQNIPRLSAAAIAVSALLAISAAAQQLTVVQEKAPMFKEPTISSQIIKYLEKDSKVNMLAAEDSFLLVSYGGYEGWVIPYSVTGYEKPVPAAQNDAQPAAEAPAPGADTVVDEEAPAMQMGGYLIVTNDYANVREGPGLEYKKIGRVFKGDRLEKFIKRGDWYRVKLPDNRIAFIFQNLVRDAAGPVTKPPPAAQAPAQSMAPVPQGSLEERLARLEQEVTTLRKAVRETQASLLEMQRMGSSGGQQENSLMGMGSLLNANAPTVNAGEGGSLPIIGNKATEVYHMPGSVYYDKIPEEFRVIFRSEEQAKQAGYTKSLR